MDLNTYQKLAMRTKGGASDKMQLLNLGALGISGEAGEVTDYIKKVLFHGHSLDAEKLAKELGDVMWYTALLADAIGIDLDTVAQMNIDKLKKRYPEGFSEEDSINRAD